ncbi:MAG: hypothetical protein CMG69_03860 [Candidatus Marinimicrobia bacterium]|nr:hypothetical protein [Candidatus Neomarinimicrobiota bacterium]|tara:strand:+ start:62833 stop:63963 length:1131 start_codon:yes stop_codon:yes gene_type:complete
MQTFDYLIIGGGIFGAYTAKYLTELGKKTCLIEKENELFLKASIINQARLHSGYHYPRSITTAYIADEYKERFIREHKDFINSAFEQYYAIDRYSSLTDSEQFERFCNFLNIKAEKIDTHSLFNFRRIEKLYLTEEYSFDPLLIADYYKSKLNNQKNLKIKLNCTVEETEQIDDFWKVRLRENGELISLKAFSVVNATYSGTNTINRLFNVRQIDLQHEITEMVFLSNKQLFNVGLTIMDGQFCSMMPYGLSEFISISSVSYTHHEVSYSREPTFSCQKINKDCQPDCISVCSICPAKPPSNRMKMIKHMEKYLKHKISFDEIYSRYTIKSKLQASYIDDGRPTEISKFSSNPDFYCIFAGKINSIYAIEKEINNE